MDDVSIAQGNRFGHRVTESKNILLDLRAKNTSEGVKMAFFFFRLFLITTTFIRFGGSCLSKNIRSYKLLALFQGKS